MALRSRKTRGSASRPTPNTKKNPEQSPEAPPTTDHAARKRGELGRGALFPIVGVGASAGGLEAFTQLLGALPLDTGMGFVLVQHLDPDHESALTQILSRATSLPVREITNDERVQPNHVYVIPRDTTLSIVDGVLKILPRQRTRTPQRPIDCFLESLAQDQRERAVGVVLSGTANDGTMGLEAIKAEGGITFAQDDSAKHDSMPRSAVAAGCVDLVLSPADIARELARIAKHPYAAGQPLLTSSEDDESSATTKDDPTPLSPPGRGSSRSHAEQVHAKNGRGQGAEPIAAKDIRNGYKRILSLLRAHSGVDFSLYKSTTIGRRIARRLVLNRKKSLEDYAGFLRGNTNELDALYSDVLISVTGFFRNAETFRFLEQKVLPALLKQRGEGPLRFWVLGCSTGQEAYSLAISAVEAAERAPRIRKLQLFATDLNEALLEKARQGLYAKGVVGDITPERLRRFFVETDGGYRVSKTLREMVVFARHNLTADPPFSHMDLITCRNLLIYLEPSAQKKALPLFHYALNPGGFLLLGASESVGGFTHLFEPVDRKHKIYSKNPASILAAHPPVGKEQGEEPPTRRPPVRMQRPGGPELPGGPRGELNAEREADRITLSQFAPPGVLVNAELHVLQFRGVTDSFLEPPTGKPSFDVLKMARNGLMLPLRSAINQAKKENKITRAENVRVKRGGKTRRVNLEVIPLKNLRERCFLILFEEAEKASRGRAPSNPRPARADRPTGGEKSNHIAELETELSETREYLQSMQEQLETANEEFQAANEEVQSANEELQSSNEELETSKEELESANEELTTINEEMSSRNVELNRLNSDLVNLQTAAQVAIVLLGRDLTIRRFACQSLKQFGLLVADVGRPIGHVRHNLVLGDATQSPIDLEGLSANVMSMGREQEREVRDNDGRWYSLRVRPYMTIDNKVDGAVIVLVDIEMLKRSEQAVRESEARYRAMFESTNVGVSETDAEKGRLLRVNDQFARITGYATAELVDRTFLELTHPDDRPGYEDGLSRLVRGEIAFYQIEKRLIRKDGTIVWVYTAVNLVRDAASRPLRTVTITVDMSERKRIEEALRESHAQLRLHAEELTRFNRVAVRRELRMIELKKEVDDVRRRHGEAARYPLEFEEETGIRERGPEEPSSPTASAAYQVVELKQAHDSRLAALNLMEDADQSRMAIEKLNVELRQYGAELSEADGRKNELLAMLGHELRNPLSALAHGLDLLGKVPDDPTRSEELREMMLRQTQRMGTLLDQLLDIARLTSGRVELAKRSIDMADVVRAAVETVRPLVESQNHKLILSLPPAETALVLGDLVRLAQIVENLLTNAAKYTDNGGQIALTLESDPDRVRVIVRDTGTGLSAEFLPHVFDVFTQAPRTLDRSQGGMGLGLALVRRLVEMHQGQVSASSPGLGQGSEFIVTLPRLLQRPPKDGVEHAGDPAKPSKFRPRKILVVDDEADIAGPVADLLKAEGHRALAVDDGPAALAAAHTFGPEVALLDLGLPGMDGYEVARRLREERGGDKILLIAMTGYQKDEARLKQAGFDQHLVKPLDLQKLATLIARLNGATIP